MINSLSIARHQSYLANQSSKIVESRNSQFEILFQSSLFLVTGRARLRALKLFSDKLTYSVFNAFWNWISRALTCLITLLAQSSGVYGMRHSGNRIDSRLTQQRILSTPCLNSFARFHPHSNEFESWLCPTAPRSRQNTPTWISSVHSYPYWAPLWSSRMAYQ